MKNVPSVALMDKLKKTCGGLCVLDPGSCDCFGEISDEDAIDIGMDIDDKPEPFYSKSECSYYLTELYNDRGDSDFYSDIIDELCGNDFSEEEKDEFLRLVMKSGLANMKTSLAIAIATRAMKNTVSVDTGEYVYLLLSAHGSKIGRSKNPDSRTGNISTKLPFDVTEKFIFKVKDMKSTESMLHKRYADKRMNGEWFDLSKDDIADIKRCLNEIVRAES